MVFITCSSSIRFFFPLSFMLMTLWKSALFRVGQSWNPYPASYFESLNFLLAFTILAFAFSTILYPLCIVVLSRSPYHLHGTQWAYQVPLILDMNELSILLYTDGYKGHCKTCP